MKFIDPRRQRLDELMRDLLARLTRRQVLMAETSRIAIARAIHG